MLPWGACAVAALVLGARAVSSYEAHSGDMLVESNTTAHALESVVMHGYPKPVFAAAASSTVLHGGNLSFGNCVQLLLAGSCKQIDRGMTAMHDLRYSV